MKQAIGDQLWQKLILAERAYYTARMAVFRVISSEGIDAVALLSEALGKPPERGTALRLIVGADESLRRQLFPLLVQLAAVGHSDVQLVREVIQSLDPAWVEEHIGQEVERDLQSSPTYEEYRRLAELLALLRSPYLKILVSKAETSGDADIREVAEDFKGS